MRGSELCNRRATLERRLRRIVGLWRCTDAFCALAAWKRSARDQRHADAWVALTQWRTATLLRMQSAAAEALGREYYARTQ